MDALTIAKALALPTPFILAGYGASFSQNTVPLLYAVPSNIAAKVFEGVYHNGAKFIVPGALTTIACSSYLAYAVPSQRKFYIGTAAMVASTQLFTLGVMMGGIQRLIDISVASVAEQEKADATGETVKLLKAWVWQNWVRVGLNLGAGLAAGWAVWNGDA
jgi:ABC-type multidrug transport system permease subunit